MHQRKVQKENNKIKLFFFYYWMEHEFEVNINFLGLFMLAKSYFC